MLPPCRPFSRVPRFSYILISLICIALLLTAYLQFGTYAQRRFVFLTSSPALSHRRAQPSTKALQVLPKNVPCPSHSSLNLVGAIEVSLELPSWKQLIEKYVTDPVKPYDKLVLPVNATENATASDSSTVYSLGVWSPIECRPKQTVAIVIPYRARDEHLRIFLNHMHGYFRHQQLRYTIFVVEQVGTTRFNRAALFNVGFLESARVAQFDCFIFHDVDLLPQDDRIPYQCGDQPIHLSVAVDKFGYRLLYEGLFGGVVAFDRKQFDRVHGFSNVYFGWGGEDDDMFQRLRHAGYHIFRHPSLYSRYTMIRHTTEKLNEANPHRHELLKQASKRFTTDGYTQTQYNVIKAEPLHGGLVYWIKVDLQEEKMRKAFKLA